MYDPADDDDEIPGQDSLWDPPSPAAAAGPVVEAAATATDMGATAPEVALPVVEPPTRAATEAPIRAPRPVATQPVPRRAPSRAGKGITGRGAGVLVAVVTGGVGVADVIGSGHRGSLFGVAFVLATAAGAYLVRRRDLLSAVVAPPLIYCGLIVFMSLIDSGATTGGLVTRIGVYIGDAFVTGAPSIWTGTAAAAAVGWWRSGGTMRSLPPALAARRRDRLARTRRPSRTRSTTAAR
jgi:hypothetical protein